MNMKIVLLLIFCKAFYSNGHEENEEEKTLNFEIQDLHDRINYVGDTITYCCTKFVFQDIDDKPKPISNLCFKLYNITYFKTEKRKLQT